jgi:hypothetical protein
MAANECTPYWVMLCVDLHAPVTRDPQDEADDLPTVLAGYFRNFGITAISEEGARQLAASEILDGTVSWEETESYAVSVHELPPTVIEQASDWTVPGVWYKSGRAFFPPV